jgi:sugar phosphate isomerase/epimerase
MEVGQPSLGIRSDDVVSEGMLSDSEQEYASLNTAPPGFDQFDRGQAHIDLKTFGEGLHAAAQAVFPSESRSQYTKVYVLLIRWEDEGLFSPVSTEIHELFNVFKDIYQFEVEIWKIPGTGSHVETNQKILDFVKLGGDSEEHLKIVYYAGHANLTKNKRLVWTR